MSKRRKVEAVEAEELVAAWQASGEPLSAWCSRQGIDGRSLRYWVDRVPSPVLRLVELTPPRPSHSRSGVCVRVRGMAVLVDDDFSDETLARVLRVVRAC
jgi:hypothetical protein